MVQPRESINTLGQWQVLFTGSLLMSLGLNKKAVSGPIAKIHPKASECYSPGSNRADALVSLVLLYSGTKEEHLYSPTSGYLRTYKPFSLL